MAAANFKFRILGNGVEYTQAARRLEELQHSGAGTPAAIELKELTRYFRAFEKEVHYLKRRHNLQTVLSRIADINQEVLVG